jgi:ankyrin repeat protein
MEWSLFSREQTTPKGPNIVTDSGEYALGDAAYLGKVDVMKLLLDRPDVDPNFAGGWNGTTPLILGAHFPDVLKLLLDQQGIDVNYQIIGTPHWPLPVMGEAGENTILSHRNTDLNILNIYGDSIFEVSAYSLCG